jgi:beta-lactamase class A
VTEESAEEVAADIMTRANQAGVEVWLHARALDGGPELSIRGTEPVVTASVFKVPVAVELARQAAESDVELTELVTVRPGEGPPSPYGLAAFRHETTLSWDALATLMISVSDNVATDLVLAKVGKDAVNALLARLGLPGTAVTHSCAELLATIGDDLGIPYEDDERVLSGLTARELGRLSALDPARTCRTTPEEATRLLAMIWHDSAAPARACADVRRWLGGQVWPHRLRSGFVGDDVRVSGKTGTLPTIRNEIGVVEYENAGYAVAVFTRAEDARSQVPARDAFIGFAGARAVGWLRARTS